MIQVFGKIAQFAGCVKMQPALKVARPNARGVLAQLHDRIGD